VSTGTGKSFTGLAVGETHELPIVYTFQTTGSRDVALTATIKTGYWSWPDRESFTDTVSVLIEKDSCIAPYTGEDVAVAEASEAASLTVSFLMILGCLAFLN
jgi:hypothetical protein